MSAPIKLVAVDSRYSAGLILAGYPDVAAVVAELRGVACRGSASLFLEDAAMACLRSGHLFDCADPMLDGLSGARDIVVVELDDHMPFIPFVQIHRIDEKGVPVRTNNGTLDGVATALGLLEHRLAQLGRRAA